MKELVARFKALDTTCVSDALDRLGVSGGAHGIKPVLPGKKICGTAFTVRYVPCRPAKGSVGDFLDDVKPGEVVVIDNGGRDYCTVWGDIMSVVAKKGGVEGTVIDGVCRDVPALKDIGYPMFAKGYYMVTGKDRVEVESVNQTVSLSGVSVAPGDIILGDDSGIVVIPRTCAEEVLKAAEHIDDTEKFIRKEIENNATLREAREKANYHHLQTRTL
ncbi:MAG: RraA family protein [Desulfovibrio sp.]|nr:RraA family protein [Desulfovibrio sp.]